MVQAVSREEETAELLKILTWESIAKSQNLGRLLQYICGKYLDGHASELKEYNIGVEALGRPPDFDPANNSIVRVELHRLREKLKRYYETEGVNDPTLIVLEPGKYAPRFVPRSALALEKPAGRAETAQNSAPAPGASLRSKLPEPVAAPPRHGSASFLKTAALVIVAVAVVALLATLKKEPARSESSLLGTSNPVSPALDPAREVRILAGYSRSNYIDKSGKSWAGDRYFSGGTATGLPRQFIARTLDTTLFQNSRTGNFAYDIPLQPGVYELHLYFVETYFGPGSINGGGESSRIFDIVVNGVPLMNQFDVIRDAGSNNTADERVFKDVSPASDGRLHIQFRHFKDEPMVSAIELVPGIPGRLRPVRIVAQDNSYTDHEGHVWGPDSFFGGGQLALHRGPVQDTSDPDLYDGERYGNFSYAIPVAEGSYAVTLRFAETYFGTENLGTGGPGARIFDVYANGVALLRNFDVFKEASGANRAVEKTFHHLTPNAQGKLRFDFVPTTNYACVNAIEVVDESR